jgi:hypothetical protein
MALTNYSDLKTSVANYLGRSDLTSQIPDFISLAEIRLNRDLRIRQMLVTATATMTGGDSTVGLPSDFLEMRDIFVEATPRISVQFLSPAAFSRDARATDSGRPVFYTMRGAEFEFAPIPDTNYTLQMIYYAKQPALSDSNPSNAFMANCPDALLYAALGEAEPYLMNDARTGLWAQFYQNAIDRLNDSNKESEYAGVPLTMTVTSR